MIKSILQKGGASFYATRIGISTVVVSAAIWTGTVVQIPSIWRIPAFAVVFTGVKKLTEYKRAIKQEHNLLPFLTITKAFKFQPTFVSIPIARPGGVPGIRAPPW